MLFLANQPESEASAIVAFDKANFTNLIKVKAAELKAAALDPAFAKDAPPELLELGKLLSSEEGMKSYLSTFGVNEQTAEDFRLVIYTDKQNNYTLFKGKAGEALAATTITEIAIPQPGLGDLMTEPSKVHFMPIPPITLPAPTPGHLPCPDDICKDITVYEVKELPPELTGQVEQQIKKTSDMADFVRKIGAKLGDVIHHFVDKAKPPAGKELSALPKPLTDDTKHFIS